MCDHPDNSKLSKVLTLHHTSRGISVIPGLSKILTRFALTRWLLEVSILSPCLHWDLRQTWRQDKRESCPFSVFKANYIHSAMNPHPHPRSNLSSLHVVHCDWSDWSDSNFPKQLPALTRFPKIPSQWGVWSAATVKHPCGYLVSPSSRLPCHYEPPPWCC